MKRFIAKSFRFYSVPVLFSLIWIVSLEFFLKCDICSDKITFDHHVDYKIESILPSEVKESIIICGDSRAERQIIPNIINQRIGRESYNIGVSSGDLSITTAAIKDLDSSNIFLVSASSWQVNDGAIDKGYLSLKMFSQLSFREKIHIYKNYEGYSQVIAMYGDLSLYLIQKIVSWSPVQKDEYARSIDAHGFLEVNGVYYSDTLASDSLIDRHPWYKSLDEGGFRSQIFKRNLEQLANCGAMIYLIQPPVCDYWRNASENTSIDDFERHYSNTLEELSRQYSNVTFWDFYSYDPKELTDSMFYDIQHLNFAGAQKFSQILSDSLKSK